MKRWQILLGFGITLTLLSVSVIIGANILAVFHAAEIDAAYQACIARNGMAETAYPDDMIRIADMCAGYLR